MNLPKKLKNLSVAIVTHVYASGPSFNLEEYLILKVKELVFLGHPFSFAPDVRSFQRIYQGGKLVQKNWAPKVRLPGLTWYLKDIFFTFFWILAKRKKFDLFFGVNGLNASCGILLKKLGLVGKVVFYVIDYIPQRFENPILNSLYHFIDRFAVAYSDFVYNLSPIMVKEREKRGVAKKYRAKQLVVPVGTELKVKPPSFSKIHRFDIAYLGHLVEKQGIQLVIQALPKILVKLPSVRFLILGGGEYEGKLKKMVKRLNLEDRVEFAGFIADHTKVEKRLSFAALAVAPYTDDPKNFVRYTDPGKVKAYLAVGLPVIITNVPAVAEEIARKHCGLVTNYNVDEFAQAVIKILGNEALLKQFRQNAAELGQKYDWNLIFEKALKETI